MNQLIKKQIYYVKGMHCSSCEILIEKKLTEQKNIKLAEASNSKGCLKLQYVGKKPTIEELNNEFAEDGYRFSETENIDTATANKKGYLAVIIIPIVIISLFILFNSLGLTGLVTVNSTSSLPTFLFLGIVAGLSTCAALVGGIVLSMSKQWSANTKQTSTSKKIQPHLYFNAGRLASYAVLGMILGALGSAFRLSISLSSLLVIGVSLLMIVLGLQMYGIKSFQKIRIALPKFISRYAANKSESKSRAMPFTVGALTFFLPCGFTITAQSMALLSGNFWQGGLIMLFFALGTLPTLLTIGITSMKLLEKPHISQIFLKTAGVVVLFFALFNINSQFNVLGWPSFSDMFSSTKQSAAASDSQEFINGLAPMVSGKQVIEMKAMSNGYEPNYFVVRSGVPVRWEIENVSASGCTNAVIAKSLFNGEIKLTPGSVSVKEFTPTKPGRYKFSCWMGMVWGTIDVVSADDVSTEQLNIIDPEPAVGSGGGCGCGQSSCTGTR